MKTRVSILFKDGKALSAQVLLVLLGGLIYAQIFLQHSQRKKGYAVLHIVHIKLHSLSRRPDLCQSSILKISYGVVSCPQSQNRQSCIFEV